MSSDSEKTAAEMREIDRNSLLAERQKLRDQLAEIEDQRARLRWQSDDLRHNLNRLRVKIENFETDSLMYTSSTEDLGFGTWHVIDVTESPFVLLNLSMDQPSCLTWLENFGLGLEPRSTISQKRIVDNDNGFSLKEMLHLLKTNAQISSTFTKGHISYEEMDKQGKPKSLTPIVKMLRVIYTPPSSKTFFPDSEVSED